MAPGQKPLIFISHIHEKGAEHRLPGMAAAAVAGIMEAAPAHM